MVLNTLHGVCFGEILFDVFPNRKEIGGAPLNVASRLHSFNIQVSMISAVGNDENGMVLLNYLKEIHLTTDLIQINPNFPTGEVQITLNAEGNASYNIQYPVAWDKISLLKQQIEVVRVADFFVFGSLVARDEISKSTLLKLIKHASYKIFDINLRKPHYTKTTLIKLMNVSDFIKLNDEEIIIVSEILGSTADSLESRIQFISEKTATQTICVTLGSKGAVLYKDEQFYYGKGYTVKVEDTVGAGDSFLASLIAKLFDKETPQKAIDYACAVGALVASYKGANPSLSEDFILDFVTR